MALKIVQNIGEFSFNNTTITSDPIPLKSGYLRVANGSFFAHVAIGTGTTATELDFGVPASESVILRERVSVQSIVGIVTGAQTVLIAPEGNGQPFEVGDYIEIGGVSPTGINTNWAEVLSISGRNITVNVDSSSITGPFTFNGAHGRRAVKVSFSTTHGAAFAHLSEVQIAGG